MDVYDQLYGAKDELLAAKRIIAKCHAALTECEVYFDDRSDVVDGSYGEPAPNREMTLLTEVQAALADLDAWGKAAKERIEMLPLDWQDILRMQYSTRRLK